MDRLADPRLADPRLADPRLADPCLADPTEPPRARARAYFVCLTLITSILI